MSYTYKQVDHTMYLSRKILIGLMMPISSFASGVLGVDLSYYPLETNLTPRFYLYSNDKLKNDLYIGTFTSAQISNNQSIGHYINSEVFLLQQTKKVVYGLGTGVLYNFSHLYPSVKAKIELRLW